MTTLAAASKSRRAKGEQTRRQILEAALSVIAQQGYRAVTHRAVAKEAGVNLSLTTYYFKDLSEMLSEAFIYYKDELRKEVDVRWQQLFAYLDQFDSDQLKQADIRADVVETLARAMSDYIENQVLHHPQNVAVEMTYYFDLHLHESQRELAYSLRSRFLGEFVELCQRLGSVTPDVDAELIMGTLHRLECQAIAVPRLYEPQSIYLQAHRLIGALTAL